jgi:hypothetical protein
MKKLTFLIVYVIVTNTLSAQVKVFSGGNTIIGSTNSPVSGAKFQVSGASVFTTATGTVSPTSAPLIQSVNAYSSAGAPDYTWSGDINTGLFHPGPDTLAFSTAGQKRIHINPNGNIAIGNYAPKEFFQLGDRFTFHNGGTKYLGFNSYYDAGAGTNKRLVADYASSIAFGGGDIVFNVATTSTAGSAITFTDALHVKNDGKIGIGNNAPNYQLDVNGGDINIYSLSNGYRINSNLVLTQRNITSGLFVGNGAGNSNTASNITAVGYKALYSNTSGTPNNAFGAYALYSNTTGTFNLAIGDSALYTNTSSSNVAIGTNSLLKNSTGSNNTAVGIKSGYSNTTGVANSIFGFGSLYKSTAGAYNSAFGYEALFNSTNSYNSAFGAFALFTNTSGDNNIAVGYQSLYNNSMGDHNSASGYFALNANSTGSFNTALGSNAGITNTTGSNNTFIGYGADANGTNYSNATAVGNGAIVTATNKIRVGNTAVTQIGGQVAWSTLSDGRFKTNIQENVKGLEFIKKLRPVTYKVDAEALDNYLIQNFPDSIKHMHQAGLNFAPASAVIHSGFIAQEVEQAAQAVGYVNTIVSTPSNENDVYALSYSELVVPLVKAMQEQSSQVDSLTSITHKLDSINRLLQNQINDVINNCCQRKTTPTTTDRTIDASTTATETNNIETANWLA